MKKGIKKPLLVAGVATSVVLAGVTGLGMASAATASTDGQSLVDKIAAKFSLNKSDVQAVFDQDRASHEAERQQALETRLTQAVTDKKITADQKDKILAKLKEFQAQRDADRASMQSKTPAERRAAMDAERAALEQWAKANGIPMECLHFGHASGGPRGDR